MKRINGLIIIVLISLCTACQKEKEDYRDTWAANYDITIIEYTDYGDTTSGCGDVEITFQTYGRIFYDNHINDNELVLEYNIYDRTYHIFKLDGKNGNFISSQDGENYEKGNISTDGTLFYEKRTRVNEQNIITTTIKGVRLSDDIVVII